MTNDDREFLKLTSDCCFEWDKWGNKVYLNYTEHSTDHWSSDTVTSVDIEKDEAQKIVDFLRSKYDLS